MDPNAALAALRELAGCRDDITDHPGQDWSDRLLAALENFEALDEWLTSGGALPHAWAAARH